MPVNRPTESAPGQVRSDAEFAQPGGAGLAMIELALQRLIMRKVVEIPLGDHRLECQAQAFACSVGQRFV